VKAIAINAWARVFESSLLKDSSGVVSLPMKRGTGISKLAQFPDGAAAYGIFIALLPIAIGCVPRGTLTWSDKDGTKPHDAASISLITGFPAETVQKAIDVLLDIGWLEWVECESAPAVAKVPTPRLEDFLKEMKAKVSSDSGSLISEWEHALKGMKPSDARRVFRCAVPGISYPSQFLKHRRDMGL
jgi:hypothetical protein